MAVKSGEEEQGAEERLETTCGFHHAGRMFEEAGRGRTGILAISPLPQFTGQTGGAKPRGRAGQIFANWLKT